MRTLPFFKPKNKPQFAGLNVSDASSGGGGGGASYTAGGGINIDNNVISADLYNNTIGKIGQQDVVTKVYTLDGVTFNNLPTGASSSNFGDFYDNPISVIDVTIYDNNGRSFKPVYAFFSTDSGHKILLLTFTQMPIMSVTSPTVVITYTK